LIVSSGFGFFNACAAFVDVTDLVLAGFDFSCDGFGKVEEGGDVSVFADESTGRLTMVLDEEEEDDEDEEDEEDVNEVNNVDLCGCCSFSSSVDRTSD
jgi:hypothetical protein